MAYILHAREQAGELPRMVWVEGVGEFDGVKITVANALGLLGSAVGNAAELEALGNGPLGCVSSGQIWLERTIEPHIWNISLATAPQLGDIALSAFEFACAIQRVQLERMNYVGAPETNLSAEPRRDDFTNHSVMSTTRGGLFDA